MHVPQPYHGFPTHPHLDRRGLAKASGFADETVCRRGQIHGAESVSNLLWLGFYRKASPQRRLTGTGAYDRDMAPRRDLGSVLHLQQSSRLQTQAQMPHDLGPAGPPTYAVCSKLGRDQHILGDRAYPPSSLCEVPVPCGHELQDERCECRQPLYLRKSLG